MFCACNVPGCKLWRAAHVDHHGFLTIHELHRLVRTERMRTRFAGQGGQEQHAGRADSHGKQNPVFDKKTHKNTFQ